MTADFTQVKKLTDHIAGALADCSELLGKEDKTKEAKYGFVPGLGLEREAQELENNIETLKQGLFQVVFMGTFGSGKSTFINALLKKELLGRGIVPVQIITKVRFGAKEEAVTVFYKTGTKSYPETEKMSVEDFFEKLRFLSNEEMAFPEIKYAEITQRESLFENMVQLVELPALHYFNADDESVSFLKKADAVVFAFNAANAFNTREKDYINEMFANRQLRNVYFVITRADAVGEDEWDEFTNYVRSQLQKVFLDKLGNFDERLYNSRVFYVNAVGSLYARVGKPYLIAAGKKVIEIPISDEETGVPGFEASLCEYLFEERAMDVLRAQWKKIDVLCTHALEKAGEALTTHKQYLINNNLLELEKERYDKIKGAMFDIINQVSKSLDKKSFTRKDALDLAGQCSKYENPGEVTLFKLHKEEKVNMAADFTNVRRLTDSMTEALADYSELLGKEDKTKEGKYGFVPGIGLESEPQELRQKIEEFRQGIFQVMFTGVFSGGKSTLINALLKKNLLGVAITPETAAITKIIFGAKEEAATIFYNEETDSHPEVEKMSVEKFFEKFKLASEKDDKFLDVKYAEITQKESLFENMVQLVDSPGLNHSGIDDEKSESFLKKADAVVFLINATHALNAREKDYINAKFANRQLKNVYFVITRYDEVDDEELDNFREHILATLHNVFIDKQGNFDEKLYNERVFYVNAKGALCARTGTPFTVKAGKKIVEVPVADEETGVPEFEASMNDFLLSSDRDKAAFEAYRPKMAAMYAHASKKIDEVLDTYKRDLSGLEAEQKEVEKAIKEFKNIVEDIKTACSNASKEVIVDAVRAYDEFASDVDVSWDEYFKGRKIENFGWTAMVKIIFEKSKDKVLHTAGKVFKDMKVNDPEYEIARDKKFQELISPVTNEITAYIKLKSEILESSLSGSITAAFGKLEKLLEQYDDRISELGGNLDLSEIYLEIARKAGVDISKLKGDFSYGKLILALLYHDYDSAGSLILDSSKSWMDTIKDVIVNCIVEAIIASIVVALTGTYLIYIIARVVYGLFKMNKGFGNMASKIIEGSKAETVNNLKEERLSYQINLESGIGGVIKNANVKASQGLLDALQEKENTLNTIISNSRNKSFDLEKEKERYKKIKGSMVDIVNRISKDLDGKTFSEKDVLELAVK